MAREDALAYIETLILQLLGMLCAAQPHTVQDVEERVVKTFPHPIDKWAIGDALNALDKGKGKKSPLVLPVDKIHPLLSKEVLNYKLDHQVTIYIVAVLEYIAADILKLTGNYVKNIKHHEITLQDIKVAMCADKVLMDMFFQDSDEDTTTPAAAAIMDDHTSVRRDSLTYEDIVKDLILEETQYMRDLSLIIKVFRDPFARLFPKSKDLEVIFGDILDVHELSANLLSSLEDTVEATEEQQVPWIGTCFEELIEGAEFDVYERYTENLLRPNSTDRLNTLLQRNDVIRTCQSQGRGFKESIKYVLPKLLLGPIYHFLHYFDVIRALIDTSGDEEDLECLKQAQGILSLPKVNIERNLSSVGLKKKPRGTTLRFQGRAEREIALNKMNELQKCIDGWEGGKGIGQNCHEFIMEGMLMKHANRRLTERYVFLFDCLIIFTKLNTKRSSVTGPVGDYKLKEKFNIRKIDVADREDTEDVKFSFELQPRQHPAITLVARSQEEKNNWMAALFSLLNKSMLERLLDSSLKEKQQPLSLPSASIYRFSELDSAENLVLEEAEPDAESPMIKGGTLLKLVERLTYHTYADPKFIPEPSLMHDDDSSDMLHLVREDVKRFRKEYSKPVQFRVLNVLRHWVDQHWYDFEWNQEQLLAKLNTFLESVKGKAMRKWVESINKVITRKQNALGAEKHKQLTFQSQPPNVEWHITRKPHDFDIMTLHPIEIARQVTLLEFDLYRAVKPSEMVGSVWVKKQKTVTSPNLLRMMQHSTCFTFWLEKCILTAEQFEERVAVLSRILEIMMVFQELNNFNGVLEVISALHSAPVFRLEHSFEEVDQKNHKLMKAFDEAKDLNSDHFKRYIEKLRSIDPPCVPFLGMYLTNIILTEEGNPDFLPNRPEGIINFSKRRKVAEITAEIQQYQNQPYCLQLQHDIRQFFEELDPLEGMTEKDFNDLLYKKSLELEPRNCKQPTKAERKREYSLKSPGIKPMSSRHSASTLKSERQHPASLSSSSLQRTPDDPAPSEVDFALPSCGATPPTPGTPITTPPPRDSSDNSVFAPVMLPGSASFAGSTPGSILAAPLCSSSSSLPSGGLSGGPIQVSMPPPPPKDLPPRLPPRRKQRDSSVGGCGELSPVRVMPVLPPRDSQPPPCPLAPPGLPSTAICTASPPPPPTTST
ncbi:hypothetical protein CAPTEDRAFT_226962 [Capitella teleta]|uniref:Son of sevenless n=1 Tax=Capitella teleta TaxID=283909 RepID=R7TNE9_CAPTE|nr:hypothetical protein CAPTEDRAFT_226962 [Capitella teleta]|eukprot:ELT95072.1 hypothetical protein CAPTEDRAFT_226962 [Capitella teleta]